MANGFCSSSGGATTTAPAAWTNSSLAEIFGKAYTKSIATYWPYLNSNSIMETTKSSRFPTWAAAVIGVLCSLLVIALAVGYWYRRRQNKQKNALVEEAKAVDTPRDIKLIYEGHQTSPGPGPESEATGMETVPGSLISSATPVTVESGGGAVYEMHGMLLTAPLKPSFAPLNPNLTFLKIRPRLNFLHSSMPHFTRSIHIHNPVRRGASRLQSHHRPLLILNRGYPLLRSAADVQVRSR